MIKKTTIIENIFEELLKIRKSNSRKSLQQKTKKTY
jgi:hypothetical protein